MLNFFKHHIKPRGLLVYLLLLGLGWAFGQQMFDYLQIEARSINDPTMRTMVLTAMGLFIVTSAIPFVPGAEIGFALLLLFGTEAVPLVYCSMVFALLLAFIAGSIVPADIMASFFGWLGLERARRLTLELNSLQRADRLNYINQRAPARITPYVTRYRYIVLAVILNLPGNVLLGGAGGIAFAAGTLGIYRVWAFCLTAMIAVLPVPLLIYVIH